MIRTGALLDQQTYTMLAYCLLFIVVQAVKNGFWRRIMEEALGRNLIHLQVEGAPAKRESWGRFAASSCVITRSTAEL
jgi:ABC-type lipoprotein release transport system permease subunit